MQQQFSVTPGHPNQGRPFGRQLDTVDLFSIEIRANGSISTSENEKSKGTQYG
jgi:hypothetical protein